MEAEGFKRGVCELKKFKVPIKQLVTDRHTSIAAIVKEDLKETKHKFDIWHVAKGKEFIIIIIDEIALTELILKGQIISKTF